MSDDDYKVPLPDEGWHIAITGRSGQSKTNLAFSVLDCEGVGRPVVLDKDQGTKTAAGVWDSRRFRRVCVNDAHELTDRFFDLSNDRNLGSRVIIIEGLDHAVNGGRARSYREIPPKKRDRPQLHRRNYVEHSRVGNEPLPVLWDLIRDAKRRGLIVISVCGVQKFTNGPFGDPDEQEEFWRPGVMSEKNAELYQACTDAMWGVELDYSERNPRTGECPWYIYMFPTVDNPMWIKYVKTRGGWQFLTKHFKNPWRNGSIPDFFSAWDQHQNPHLYEPEEG